MIGHERKRSKGKRRKAKERGLSFSPFFPPLFFFLCFAFLSFPFHSKRRCGNERRDKLPGRYSLGARTFIPPFIPTPSFLLEWKGKKEKEGKKKRGGRKERKKRPFPFLCFAFFCFSSLSFAFLCFHFLSFPFHFPS